MDSSACTLEAAEEVAGADLDTLQSLVDKSLLRHTDRRRVDSAEYEWGPAQRGVVGSLASGRVSGWWQDRLAGIERLLGSRFADQLFGSPRSDEIYGGGGADLVVGAGGNDALIGAEGADRILGGPGRDALDGGEGWDRLDGGTGRDRCTTGERRRSCP